MLSESSRARLTRQVVTTAAGVFCLVGTAVGTGLIGTPVAETGEGALSADATLVAPAGPAFSIWSVIYLGLVAFTLWQWLPKPSRSERVVSLGYLPAASLVLNGVWILVAQSGVIWLSAVVIVALLLVLGILVRRLSRSRGESVPERVVVDGTFGLYLGWVAVATCANITTALVAAGAEPPAALATLLGVVVVLVAAAVAAWLARRLGGRVAVALAMAWGLVWIAVGRFSGEPPSLAVAVTAVLGALVALAAVVVVRLGHRAPALSLRDRTRSVPLR